MRPLGLLDPGCRFDALLHVGYVIQSRERGLRDLRPAAFHASGEVSVELLTLLGVEPIDEERVDDVEDDPEWQLV